MANDYKTTTFYKVIPDDEYEVASLTEDVESVNYGLSRDNAILVPEGVPSNACISDAFLDFGTDVEEGSITKLNLSVKVDGNYIILDEEVTYNKETY